MKKKNIVAVALAGTAIALLLTACGKKGSTQQKETADNQTTTKVQDVTGKQETDENEEKAKTMQILILMKRRPRKNLLQM